MGLGVRAAPGKSGLHARGEGERVMALDSREGTRASRPHLLADQCAKGTPYMIKIAKYHAEQEGMNFSVD